MTREKRINDLLNTIGFFLGTYGEGIDALLELQKLLEQPSPASGWLPIESAPKDGTSVIGHYGEFGAVGEIEFYDGCWTWVGNRFKELDPTHWQPLPTPPQPIDCNDEVQPQPIGCNQEAQPQHESCECYPANTDVYMLVECTKRIIRSDQNQIIQEHKDIMDKYIGKLITKTSEEAR